jgi:hypothetical protein
MTVVLGRRRSVKLEELVAARYGVVQLLRIAVVKLINQARREFALRSSLFALARLLFLVALRVAG